MAPPAIAITKSDEPWLVYFPNFLIASENILDQPTEKNNPDAMIAQNAIFPLEKIPINNRTALTPEKSANDLAGLLKVAANNKNVNPIKPRYGSTCVNGSPLNANRPSS